MEETPASEIQDVDTGATTQPGAAPESANAAQYPNPAAPSPSEQITPEPGPAPNAAGAPRPAPPPAPPAPESPLPPAPTPEAPPAPSPKVMSQDWPVKGYSGPQPWEADNPPALTQNHLMVSSGSAGEAVVELAALLAHLGYATSISSGQNPHAIYDNGVAAAVQAFCTDYGVQEDPQVLQARTVDTVGPWIWEALTRAVHKKLAEATSEQSS